MVKRYKPEELDELIRQYNNKFLKGYGAVQVQPRTISDPLVERNKQFYNDTFKPSYGPTKNHALYDNLMNDYDKSGITISTETDVRDWDPQYTNPRPAVMAGSGSSYNTNRYGDDDLSDDIYDTTKVDNQINNKKTQLQSYGVDTQKADPIEHEKGIIMRALSALGSAGSFVTGGLHGALDSDPETGFWSEGKQNFLNAWSKKDKPIISGSDVVNDLGWETNDDSGLGERFLHGTAGLALDVLTDPLTYLTLGAGAGLKGTQSVATTGAKTAYRELAEQTLKKGTAEFGEAEIENLARRAAEAQGKAWEYGKGIGVELPFTNKRLDFVKPETIAQISDKIGISSKTKPILDTIGNGISKINPFVTHKELTNYAKNGDMQDAINSVLLKDIDRKYKSMFNIDNHNLLDTVEGIKKAAGTLDNEKMITRALEDSPNRVRGIAHYTVDNPKFQEAKELAKQELIGLRDHLTGQINDMMTRAKRIAEFYPNHPSVNKMIDDLNINVQQKVTELNKIDLQLFASKAEDAKNITDPTELQRGMDQIKKMLNDYQERLSAHYDKENPYKLPHGQVSKFKSSIKDLQMDHDVLSNRLDELNVGQQSHLDPASQKLVNKFDNYQPNQASPEFDNLFEHAKDSPLNSAVKQTEADPRTLFQEKVKESKDAMSPLELEYMSSARDLGLKQDEELQYLLADIGEEFETKGIPFELKDRLRTYDDYKNYRLAQAIRENKTALRHDGSYKFDKAYEGLSDDLVDTSGAYESENVTSILGKTPDEIKGNKNAIEEIAAQWDKDRKLNNIPNNIKEIADQRIEQESINNILDIINGKNNPLNNIKGSNIDDLLTDTRLDPTGKKYAGPDLPNDFRRPVQNDLQNLIQKDIDQEIYDNAMSKTINSRTTRAEKTVTDPGLIDAKHQQSVENIYNSVKSEAKNVKTTDISKKIAILKRSIETNKKMRENAVRNVEKQIKQFGEGNIHVDNARRSLEQLDMRGNQLKNELSSLTQYTNVADVPVHELNKLAKETGIDIPLEAKSTTVPNQTNLDASVKELQDSVREVAPTKLNTVNTEKVLSDMTDEELVTAKQAATENAYIYKTHVDQEAAGKAIEDIKAIDQEVSKRARLDADEEYGRKLSEGSIKSGNDISLDSPNVKKGGDGDGPKPPDDIDKMVERFYNNHKQLITDLTKAKEYYNNIDTYIKDVKKVPMYKVRQYTTALVNGTATAFPKNLQNVYKEVRQLFNDWGMKENDAELIHQLMGSYVFHTLSEEGKKVVKQGLKKAEFKDIHDLSAVNYNSLTRQHIGKIREINAEIAEKTNGKVKNFFEESISKIVLERGMMHNKLMFEHGFQEEVLRTIGKPIHDLKTDAIPDDWVVVYPKGEFKPVTNVRGIVTQEGLNNLMSGTVEGVLKDVKNAAESMFYDGKKAKELRLMDESVFKKGQAYAIPEAVFNDMKNIGRLTLDEDTKLVGKIFDKFINIVKLTQTAIIPGFHVRNEMSNTFNNFLDIGVQAVNPKNHVTAIKILKGSKDDIIKIGNVEKSAAAWKNLAEQHGVLQRNFYESDITQFMRDRINLIDEDNPLKRLAQRSNPFSQNFLPYEVGRKVGSKIEDKSKLVNFIVNLGNGHSPESAADQVNKFLFDYSDLTDFERHIMKRMIPFYTWMRKNVPLQIEQLFSNPRVYNTIGKAKNNFESMSPNNDEQNLPDYLNSWWRTPLGVENSKTGVDDPLYMNVPLPYQDLGKIPDFSNGFQEGAKDWFQDRLSETNPLIKSTIELSQDKGWDLGLRSPIMTNKGELDQAPTYLSNPLYKLISDTTSQVPVLDSLVPDVQQGANNEYMMDPKTRHLLKTITALENYDKMTNSNQSKEKQITNILSILAGLKFSPYDQTRSDYWGKKNEYERLLQIDRQQTDLGNIPKREERKKYIKKYY